MKLISARQAWHDALHENRSSVMAVAAEQARLPTTERQVAELLGAINYLAGAIIYLEEPSC